MKPGDLVEVVMGGYPDDVPAVDEARGSKALYVEPKPGQQTLGGGVRILWQGRLMLVQPGALVVVQPAQEVV
jgi:hypothetical protein